MVLVRSLDREVLDEILALTQVSGVKGRRAGGDRSRGHGMSRARVVLHPEDRVVHTDYHPDDGRLVVQGPVAPDAGRDLDGRQRRKGRERGRAGSRPRRRR